MSNEFVLDDNREDASNMPPQPYAIIECETEDAFRFLQEAVEFYKQYKAQEDAALVMLSLDDLGQMVGASVYIEATWGSFCNYKGQALVVRSSSEGFVLQFEGKQHSFLNSWYGAKWKAYARDL